jgi:hypothetical protein
MGIALPLPNLMTYRSGGNAVNQIPNTELVFTELPALNSRDEKLT